METKLEHGKWYKCLDYTQTIIFYNSSDPDKCYGYWEGVWDIDWYFPIYNDLEEATYAELEALGTQHREHYVFSLEELKNGVCACLNDSDNIDHIFYVMKYCFPNDTDCEYNPKDKERMTEPNNSEFFHRDDDNHNNWFLSMDTELPFHSVTKFYEQLPKEEVTQEEAVGQLEVVSNRDVYVKRFPSGAIRSDSRGKIRVDFISPYALELIAKHHTKNSDNFNGEDEFGANYFKGIKPVDINQSLSRHWLDFQKALIEKDKENIREELIALASNCLMSLHQIVLEEKGLYKEIYDKIEYVKQDGNS